MDETAYHQAVDRLYDALQARLDRYDTLDYDIVGGVLQATGPNGTMVVSRQPPLREVWLAMAMGGFHFRWADDQWRDTRQPTASLDDRIDAWLVSQGCL
jgi:CyaY protein